MNSNREKQQRNITPNFLRFKSIYDLIQELVQEKKFRVPQNKNNKIKILKEALQKQVELVLKFTKKGFFISVN